MITNAGTHNMLLCAMHMMERYIACRFTFLYVAVRSSDHSFSVSTYVFSSSSPQDVVYYYFILYSLIYLTLSARIKMRLHDDLCANEYV
jgi:hypothetical protein